MNTRVRALVAIAAAACLLPAAAFAAIPEFTQDFEALEIGDESALGDDGWLVFATVFAADGGGVLYSYGPFPAPNNPAAPAFCNLVTGEGGAEQGEQQLSVYSDYENTAAQTAGDVIEANVYKEFTIEASDVGKVCTFAFQAKRGNLEPPTTAAAFIKTLDPDAGYATTNLVSEDMTAIGTDWSGWSLELTIDADLVGQLFQIGFTNSATDYDGSSIIYDNVDLSTEGGGATDGIGAYSQDFEALAIGDVDALGDDGWLVFANVFPAGGGSDPLYSYGPFPAPNNPSAPAFCNLVSGQGGAEQGAQQLSVFSDYENTAAHSAGEVVEANVFREQTIGAADVGKTWLFEFQAKRPAIGAVAPPSTAYAFIKTLDPGAGFMVTNFETADMTSIPGEWNGYSVSLTIDAALVGQVFQIGFANTATNFDPSAVIYDNVVLREDTGVGVPDVAALADARLRQNYPNPFNPQTRIEFALDRAMPVELAIYDVAGRLVTRLVHEHLAAGEHAVTWDGRTDRGARAASGHYRYVLRTPSGQVARSMVLLK